MDDGIAMVFTVIAGTFFFGFGFVTAFWWLFLSIDEIWQTEPKPGHLLEGQVIELKDQVTSLKSQVTQLNRKVTSLEDQDTSLNDQATSLKDQARWLKRQVTQLKHQHSAPPPYPSAERTHEPAGP
jgi:septation ring formation regulator EzrA